MEPIWSELSMERVADRSAAQLLVESDIPIPAGREAQRILFAQGSIRNEVTHCANGRVQAEGSLSLQMLLLEQDNTPYGMRASTQYSHDITAKGVREGMRATVKPQMLDLRCALRDRRIHLEAVAELNAVAEQNEHMRVLSDVAGVQNLQKQYTEKEIGQWKEIGGSTLRLHEEIAADGVQQLLLGDAVPQVNGCVLEENGIAVRGTIYVCALYMDKNGQLLQQNCQIPFEELISVELHTSECRSVHVTPAWQDVSLQISENESCLDLDITIFLQAHCITVARVQALSDAYTPNGACVCHQEQVERLSPVACQQQVTTIQESLRTPEGASEALRPVFASARATLLGVSENDGQLVAEGLLITSIVYQTDEGQLTGFEEDVPFQCTLDAPFMADADVQIRVLEARCTGSGRMLNCTFTIEASVVLRETVYISLATNIEEGEPVRQESGIMLSFASAGDTFWSMGKRYGVTVEQLQEWNKGVQEPFEEGCPLMILSSCTRR